jgi:hypothetical protein
MSDEKHKTAKLKHASLSQNGGKTNLTLQLSGHETVLAQAEVLLKAFAKSAYCEHDREHNVLRITTSLPGQKDAMLEATDFVQLMSETIKLRLSGVYMQPDCDNLGVNENAIFTPAINIRLSEAHDETNIAGHISLELVRRNHGLLNNYAADPRPTTEGLRLMNLTQVFNTDTEALSEAEGHIRDAEKNLGLFNAQPTHLRLVNLRTSMMENAPGGLDEMHVATARLQGTQSDLERAIRTLKHRHRQKITELNRGDDFLDVGTGSERPIDATGLLAAVHMTTGCELPVNVQPLVTRSKTPPYAYEPALEMHVDGSKSDRHQVTLRHAAARYAGSFVPSRKYSVPQEIDPETPSRVIVHEGHTDEDRALRSAETLANTIAKRFKGGNDIKRSA